MPTEPSLQRMIVCALVVAAVAVGMWWVVAVRKRAAAAAAGDDADAIVETKSRLAPARPWRMGLASCRLRDA